MKRTVLGAILGVLILIAVSGCSFVRDSSTVVGTMVDDAASEAIVQSLEVALDTLPGVEKATADFDAFGMSGREASVEIRVAHASAGQLVAIADAVRLAFRDPKLKVTQPVATVSLAGGSRLVQTAFAMSRADLAADVTYWVGLIDILKTPLDMELTGEKGGYVRGIGSPNTAGPSARELRDLWPKVLALADTSSAASKALDLPGLQIGGVLPQIDVLDLLADVDPALGPAVGFVSRPGIAPTTNLWLWIGSAPGSITASTDWPQIVGAARLAIASGLPHLQFSYLANPDSTVSQGAVFFGPCPFGSTVQDGDTAFAAALRAAGVTLPDGSGAGRCDLR